MNETSNSITAEEFRKLFKESMIDYLHENGIELYKLEEIFARYEENEIAHGINLGFSMAIEQVVDQVLLSENVLTSDQLGTEIDSDFSVELNEATGKPEITADYKLFYEHKNLRINIDFQFELNDIKEDEKINTTLREIKEKLGKQISK